MTEDSEKQTYDPLVHLAEIKSIWSDGIPKEIVHSDSRLSIKARRNYFVGIVADVSNALTGNLITTQEKNDAANELIQKFTSDEFNNQELTTPEDIAEANRLVDIIVGK
jgi:hypothetical protein